MVTHQSTARPRWRRRLSLVGTAALIAVSSACTAGVVETEVDHVAPMAAGNSPNDAVADQSEVACGEFCTELNTLSTVVTEAGVWVLNEVGYVDRPLRSDSLAQAAAVGTYTLDKSTASVAAFQFSDDDAAAEFARGYVAKEGEPDHKGPAYQDNANSPFGTRLDFDRATTDVVLWYGQNGLLFILEAPQGLGNDFYLSFEW